MRVDSHQHFWRYDPESYPWITEEMAVIRRDFMPKDLQGLLGSNEIDGCVAVQARQSEAETEFLLELAEEYPFISAVVGWLDLKGEDLAERLEHFATFPAFKGARHVLQAEPAGFMTDPAFVTGLQQLAAKDLSYDILTTEGQLPEVVDLVKQLPEMRLVLDHISKPNIKEASFDDWAKSMKELSQYPHVHVKLSGMATEADWQHWRGAQFKPYVDFCVEQFGPSRLMYGSDWPVCLLTGSYQRIFGVLQECIADLSAAEQDQIMGDTAAAFYRL